MAFTPSNITGKRKYTIAAPECTSSSFCSDKDDYYMLNSTIHHRESRNIEFKAAQGNYITNMLPEILPKYGCAFANGEGGTLYLGILDNGIVRGVHWNQQTDEQKVHRIVRNVIERFLPKPPSYNVRIVPVYNRHTDRYSNTASVKSMANRKVIRIEIQAGDDLLDVYETQAHQVWMKRDGSVELLNPLEIKDLAISKYKQSLELRGAKRAKLTSR